MLLIAVIFVFICLKKLIIRINLIILKLCDIYIIISKNEILSENYL